MDNRLKEVLSRLKNDKKLMLICTAALAGIVLILFSGSPSQKQDGTDKESTVYETECEIERRLASLLKTVEGAGRISVMVTVDSLYEKTVAINTESESGENKESYKGEYVLVEQSGDSDGLVLKIMSPVIRGVGITCEGAASSAVKQEIIRLTSAALGIPVNRIWVTTMKE